MSKKKILIGITGSIAASKSPELIEKIRESGHEVKCIITKNGSQFVDFDLFPLGKASFISGDQEAAKYLDPKNAQMHHIDFAKWADIIIIAPASANTIAKLARGIADDELSSTLAASKAKVMVAPAMNKVMWEKKANLENIEIIAANGIKLLGPVIGEQACGDYGAGRMLEPQEIFDEVESYIKLENEMKGKKILLTAGPTQENIDPVRYISNRSSGKMGFALAQALIESGAEVTLVSGPVSLPTPGKCKRIDVRSAEQMYGAVKKHIKDADIFIGCAAVSDYRIENISDTKIKKDSDQLILKLIKNQDILKEVSLEYPDKFMVGFAAETNDVEENAKKKLQEKKLDVIVANEVGSDKVFDKDETSIKIIHKGGRQAIYKGKKYMASRIIIDFILSHIKAH
jgi:phosphopantothenoylcysteine decarboxylase/phosphopantothenate--cysteine ligase